MNKKKKRIFVICMIILALSLAVLLLKSPVPHIIKSVFGISRQIKRKKVKLLFESNHEELLLACRKMLLEAEDGKRDYGELWFGDEEGKKLFECLPEPLKNIEPVYIVISHESIMVALWGGMYHMGLIVFSEDFPAWGDKCHKELIEGLWYYDDRHKNTPNFEEYIESLRPKYKEINNKANK